MEAKPIPETYECRDGCPTCPCGSTGPSCACFCDHAEGAVHDHPLMVTLRGSRFAGVVVLGTFSKYGHRALTYANVAQAERGKARVEKQYNRPAWVIGNRPYYVRIG